jgi:iron uptake system EfeUOB component EfeO/EfeM
MKLAEALVNRADCQKRIEQLRQRLARSAKIQEGEAPPENPMELLAEVERTVAELAQLIKRINKTNTTTLVADTQTLTDALAERDTLTLKRGVLTGLIEAAAAPQMRWGRAEIKLFSTVNVAELQQQADALAKQARELDAQIQELNWRTELIEE